MDIVEFSKLAAEIRAKHRQGTGSDIEGFALDYDYLLDRLPLLNVGKIKKPGEPDNMLTVPCTASSANVNAATIGAALQHLWETELSYPFLKPYCSASTVVQSVDEVVLHFIVVCQERGPYIMGKIVVDMRPKKALRRKVRPSKEARR